MGSGLPVSPNTHHEFSSIHKTTQILPFKDTTTACSSAGGGGGGRYYNKPLGELLKYPFNLFSF